MSEHCEDNESRETIETNNNNDIHTYIHTYVREKISSISLPKLQNVHKVHVTLSLDSSLHEAAKFIASYFRMDVSELYAQGALRVLDEKVRDLPESIQLSVTHTLPKLPNQPMTDLEIDLMITDLSKLLNEFQKVNNDPRSYARRNFLYGKMEKQLPKAIKIMNRSANQTLRNLIIEVAEALKNTPKEKKLVFRSQSEIDSCSQRQNTEISCRSEAEAQALCEKLNRDNQP